jgi:hypothetical protein
MAAEMGVDLALVEGEAQALLASAMQTASAHDAVAKLTDFVSTTAVDFLFLLKLARRLSSSFFYFLHVSQSGEFSALISRLSMIFNSHSFSFLYSPPIL